MKKLQFSFVLLIFYGILIIYLGYKHFNTFNDTKFNHNNRQTHDKFGWTAILSRNACNDTVIYRLAKPWHNFHPNHWYHLGEYFISQISNISLSGIGSSSRHVIILVNSLDFLQSITPMTIFLLALSFRIHGGISTLTFLSDVNTKQFLPLNHGHIRWVRSDIYYQYRNVSSYEDQFILKKLYPQEHFDNIVISGCYVYGGTYGYFPMYSSKWFQNSKDIALFQSSINRMCPIHRKLFPDALIQEKLLSYEGIFKPYNRSPNQLKMVIYQRDVNRKFYRFDWMLSILYTSLKDQWHIDVIFHNEDTHPCLLHLALHDADLYVTAHGYQSLGTDDTTCKKYLPISCDRVGLLFMKKGSTILEIFPYKYFKPSYVDLAPTYGVHHRMIKIDHPTTWEHYALYFISRETCFKIRKCRSFARKMDLQLTEEHIQSVVNIAREIESSEDS